MNRYNESKIRVGVSSCLLGQEVRHDGGHKKNRFVVNNLSAFFEYRSFCPEMASGLGVPRQAIRLVKDEQTIRLLGVRSPELDITEAMLKASNEAIHQFDDISGYILKKDSPSCGMERVRVYNEHGQAERNGRGMFAAALITALPDLPVEEEGRLMDPVLRENFIERVFIYHRWQETVASGLKVRDLIEFHSRHKLILMAHDEVAQKTLGQIVASTTENNLEENSRHYFSSLMQTLKQPASRKRHTNVMMHVMGYLKKVLNRSEKKELCEILENYRQGLIPLVVPITLLKHHFMRSGNEYIEKQFYLDPYPQELMLRNHL